MLETNIAIPIVGAPISLIYPVVVLELVIHEFIAFVAVTNQQIEKPNSVSTKCVCWISSSWNNKYSLWYLYNIVDYAHAIR